MTAAVTSNQTSAPSTNTNAAPPVPRPQLDALPFLEGHGVKGSGTTYILPDEPQSATEKVAMDAQKAQAGKPLTEVVGNEVVDPNAAKTEGVTEVTAEDPLASVKATIAKAKRGSQRNRRLIEERSRLQAESPQRAQEADRLRQENLRYQENQQRLTRDPLAAMRELGVKAEDVAARAIADNTPEGKIQSVLEALNQEKQAREALEQRIQDQQITQDTVRRQRQFVKESQNEELYPKVADLAPEVVLSAAKDIIANIPQSSRGSVTNKMVLDFMEWKLTQHSKSRQEARAAKTKPEETTQETQTTTPAAQATPKTLTNKQSTSKWTRPPDLEKLSDADQKRHLVRYLDSLKAAKPEK